MQPVDGLTIRDLHDDDVETMAWAGSPTHLDYVRAAVERAKAGEVILLIAFDGDESIGQGGADLTAVEGAAKFWMFAVREDRRSQGIGSAMMSELEDRVRAAGFDTAVLSVEQSNPRAKALYERLGWDVVGETTESWQQDDGNGEVFTYTTNCWVMAKPL